jgi:chromosome segregation ATPase
MLKRVKIFIINKNKNKKSFIFNYKAFKKTINNFLSDKNIENESFKNELLKIKTIFEGNENLTICHLDDLNCRLFYIYSFLENIKKEIKELKSGNISSSENVVNIDIQELEKEIEKVENLIDSNSTEIKNEINIAFKEIKELLQSGIENSNTDVNTDLSNNEEFFEKILLKLEELSDKIEINSNNIQQDNNEEDEISEVIGDLFEKLEAMDNKINVLSEKIEMITEKVNSINVEELNSFIEEEKMAMEKAEEILNKLKGEENE